MHVKGGNTGNTAGRRSSGGEVPLAGRRYLLEGFEKRRNSFKKRTGNMALLSGDKVWWSFSNSKGLFQQERSFKANPLGGFGIKWTKRLWMGEEPITEPLDGGKRRTGSANFAGVKGSTSPEEGGGELHKEEGGENYRNRGRSGQRGDEGRDSQHRDRDTFTSKKRGIVSPGACMPSCLRGRTRQRVQS